jgi:hypothetical protein
MDIASAVVIDDTRRNTEKWTHTSKTLYTPCHQQRIIDGKTKSRYVPHDAMVEAVALPIHSLRHPIGSAIVHQYRPRGPSVGDGASDIGEVSGCYRGSRGLRLHPVGSVVTFVIAGVRARDFELSDHPVGGRRFDKIHSGTSFNLVAVLVITDIDMPTASGSRNMMSVNDVWPALCRFTRYWGMPVTEATLERVNMSRQSQYRCIDITSSTRTDIQTEETTQLYASHYILSYGYSALFVALVRTFIITKTSRYEEQQKSAVIPMSLQPSVFCLMLRVSR